MIKNIHLLNLGKIDIVKLHANTAEERLKHKIQYTIATADPVIVHIKAIQQQTAMLTPASVIHDKAVELFTPFVKGRQLVVTALPYNKELQPMDNKTPIVNIKPVDIEVMNPDEFEAPEMFPC